MFAHICMREKHKRIHMSQIANWFPWQQGVEG